MYHFTEREKSKEMLLTSKPSLIYVMLIWSLFVTIYFGLQTILLQNMYQNPQSAAQVADGTSKHYRQLFSPGKEPKVRAALHCTWFVLCRKKMDVFFKIYILCFPNLIGWYLIQAFLKTTWRICPIKLGQKIFCISLCQKGAVLCGGEMTFCPEQISLICFSSFFFVLFFFYTDKNGYYHQQLTSSGIHMNEQERERHIKQHKICERLLLSCTSTYFCGKVAQ